MIRDRNIANDAFINPSKVAGFGAGEIFYVCQSTNTAVYNWLNARIPSENLFTTIQGALDATVANRNDYVIVYPDSSDYDITATLTMTKRNVHLICPAGLGTKGFPSNAARVHMNTASTDFITVTADCIEIAGFFFKQDSTSRDDIIFLSGTRWHANIHDNFFGMSATASTSKYGIYADGACSHFSICDNYFTNYNPGAMSGTDNDIAGFIGIVASGSTRGLIRGNIMHTGGNTAVATAISCAGYGCFILENYIWEDVAFGGTEAGTLTLGISTSADCFISNNMIGITTAANGVSGGTADASYAHNYEGTSGGTALT